MNNEPLYEGIPLRAHQFVLSEFWPTLTEWQREHWFPRTWRFKKRWDAKGSFKSLPPPPDPTECE